MRSMIFSIKQTFQRILTSIAQGGGGWFSTPPKFALDQKSPLRSLQRPPVGGTDPVGNHGSRQCGILNISQPCRPPRPDTGIALLFFFFFLLLSEETLALPDVIFGLYNTPTPPRGTAVLCRVSLKPDDITKLRIVRHFRGSQDKMASLVGQLPTRE
jgi:hypothetical protein